MKKKIINFFKDITTGSVLTILYLILIIVIISNYLRYIENDNPTIWKIIYSSLLLIIMIFYIIFYQKRLKQINHERKLSS